jgi:hydroxyacylglutathione hydrolase
MPSLIDFKTPTDVSKLAELGTPKLDIIGGKDCEGVTKTPGHGETFKLGDIAFKGVHTPCHTQDSICFFVEDGNDKVVFTGDTLFIGGRLERHIRCC